MYHRCRQEAGTSERELHNKPKRRVPLTYRPVRYYLYSIMVTKSLHYVHSCQVSHAEFDG